MTNKFKIGAREFIVYLESVAHYADAAVVNEIMEDPDRFGEIHNRGALMELVELTRQDLREYEEAKNQ